MSRVDAITQAAAVVMQRERQRRPYVGSGSVRQTLGDPDSAGGGGGPARGHGGNEGQPFEQLRYEINTRAAAGSSAASSAASTVAAAVLHGLRGR